MRLIDADEVENKLAELWEKADDVNPIGYDDLMDIVYDAPTIDALPVKRGKWVVTYRTKETDFLQGKDLKCPFCGFEASVLDMSFNYCPNCGAKMDGE